MRHETERRLQIFETKIEDQIERSLSKKVDTVKFEQELRSKVGKVEFQELKYQVKEYQRSIEFHNNTKVIQKDEALDALKKGQDQDKIYMRLDTIADLVDGKYSLYNGQKLENQIKDMQIIVQELKDEQRGIFASRHLRSKSEEDKKDEVNSDEDRVSDTTEMVQDLSDSHLEDIYEDEKENNSQGLIGVLGDNRGLDQETNKSLHSSVSKDANDQGRLGKFDESSIQKRSPPYDKYSSDFSNKDIGFLNIQIERAQQVESSSLAIHIPSFKKNFGQDHLNSSKTPVNGVASEQSQSYTVGGAGFSEFSQLNRDSIKDVQQNSKISSQSKLNNVARQLLRKSQFLKSQETWYHKFIKQQMDKDLGQIDEDTSKNKDESSKKSKKSKLKMLLNKHGFGDHFLSKLKRIENLEKSQKLFNFYSQTQINELSKNLHKHESIFEQVNSQNINQAKVIDDMQRQVEDNVEFIEDFRKQFSGTADLITGLHNKISKLLTEQENLKKDLINLTDANLQGARSIDQIKKIIENNEKGSQGRFKDIEKRFGDILYQFEHIKLINRNKHQEALQGIKEFHEIQGRHQYRLGTLENQIQIIMRQLQKSSDTFLTHINSIKYPMFEELLSQKDETKAIERELKKTKSQLQNLNNLSSAISQLDLQLDQKSPLDGSRHNVSLFNLNAETPSHNISFSVSKAGGNNSRPQTSQSTNLLQKKNLRKNFNETSKGALVRPSVTALNSQRNLRRISAVSMNVQQMKQQSQIDQQLQQLHQDADETRNDNNQIKFIDTSIVDPELLKKYLMDKTQILSTKDSALDKAQISSQAGSQKTNQQHFELKKFNDLQDILKDDKITRPIDEISFSQYSQMNLRQMLSPEIGISKRPRNNRRPMTSSRQKFSQNN